MCEAVEKYGYQCKKMGEEIGAMAANRKAIENLMNRMALSLVQALNLLDIQGEERSMIAKQILH